VLGVTEISPVIIILIPEDTGNIGAARTATENLYRNTKKGKTINNSSQVENRYNDPFP